MRQELATAQADYASEQQALSKRRRLPRRGSGAGPRPAKLRTDLTALEDCSSAGEVCRQLAEAKRNARDQSWLADVKDEQAGGKATGCTAKTTGCYARLRDTLEADQVADTEARREVDALEGICGTGKCRQRSDGACAGTRQQIRLAKELSKPKSGKWS